MGDWRGMKTARTKPASVTTSIRARATANGFLAGRLRIEKQKAAAAGAGNLSAQRAALARYPIEVIDARIRDAVGDALLGLPCVVEQMAEVFKISALERGFHHGRSFFHLVQRLHCGARGQARGFFLVGKNVPGMVRGAGKKQHQAGLQLGENAGIDVQGLDLGGAIGIKTDVVESAKGCRIFVLLAYVPSQADTGNVKRAFGEIVLRERPPQISR